MWAQTEVFSYISIWTRVHVFIFYHFARFLFYLMCLQGGGDHNEDNIPHAMDLPYRSQLKVALSSSTHGRTLSSTVTYPDALTE